MAEYPTCDECGGNRSTLYEAPDGDGDALCIVCYDKRSEEGEGDA